MSGTGETPNPDPGATPAPVADPAPIVDAAPAAPPPESTPAPVVDPVPTPAPEPATPAPETPAEPVAPGIEPAPADLPALEDVGKKPDETKPGDPPPTEVKPPDAADAVVYEFKAPEGIELQPERVAEYTTVLREHGIPPEAGQRLLDMHTAEIQQIALNSVTNQYKVFNDTLKSWDDQRRGDQEIGGPGIETATRYAADARNRFVRTEAERQEFDEMCRGTGCGRHPAFWRLMSRVGRAFAEPEQPPAQRNPPPNPQPQRSGGTGFFGQSKYPTG